MQPDATKLEIWLDVNISPVIAKWMAEYTGFSVKSSYSLGFQTLDDLAIYKKAKENEFIILVSKDTDFPEMITRLGAPPKLIYLKFGNCDNQSLWNSLKPEIKNIINTLVKTDISIIEVNRK